MKQQRILVLFDTAGTPPDDQDFSKELLTEEWKTERDIITTLEALGHKVYTLGIYGELDLLYATLKRIEPDIIFNLMEHFGGDLNLDKAIVALFEMMNIRYTGCGVEALAICRNKEIAKRIVSSHGIKVPREAGFPCIVKALHTDASEGISKSSFVTNATDLKHQVKLIEDRFNDKAIVEEFIDGRELYVSCIGDKDPVILPIREISFDKKSRGADTIATYKAKWDDEYRKEHKIKNGFAKLGGKLEESITSTCKTIYKALTLDSYARIDLRLTAEGDIYFIEANPNPFLAHDEDFALSAKKAGLSYDSLLQKILDLS